LKELLKDALDKEDYEKAAKIRDELGKRNWSVSFELWFLDSKFFNAAHRMIITID
jgi:hypothetical protein